MAGYGALASLAEQKIRLVEGMAVVIYDPDDIEADAIVRFDRARTDPAGRAGAWVAHFDARKIRRCATDMKVPQSHHCFGCGKDLVAHLKVVGQRYVEHCPDCGTSVMAPMLPPPDPLRPAQPSARPTEAPLRTKALRVTALIAILLPLGMGMFGIGMHFIPMAGFRWGAILAAVVYNAILSAFLLRTRRTMTSQERYDELLPVKATLGFVMLTYFSYVSFYVTVPALLTEVIGVSAHREFVIDNVKQNNGRAGLCPYNLKLKEVTTVLGNSFCVSEAFAVRHSAGQSIQLTGTQSRFGFRFLIVN